MIRILIFSICVSCALVSSDIKAQNSHWQSITPNSLQYGINAMYEDTFNNLLYISGGGAAGTGLLVYDGTLLDTLGSYPVGLGRSIINYNGTIYTGGVAIDNTLSKWNGTIWDTTGLQANGQVVALYEYGGELYVGGNFSMIAGINSNGLAKYDGATWMDVGGFPFSYCYGVCAIKFYNGELYIGGSFGDSASNVMNIARWDGTQWRGVGGGFHGGMDEVSSFEIFNNELYIGGAFRESSGNAGNYIAKWDGATLSDVGGGVDGLGNGQIFDLTICNNSLYAVGCFVYAGGVYTSYIAKWDGTDWCGLGDTFNIPIYQVATLNSDLFIGGGWWIIGNDTISGFAKWIGGNFTANCGNMTGITPSSTQSEILVYPNPASDAVFFQLSDSRQSHSIIIYDQFGREIWREETNENLISLSVDSFSEGMYFYAVIARDTPATLGKFIVIQE